MLGYARHGATVEPDGDDDPQAISPLIYRSAALRASRVHELRVALGIDSGEDESIESAAGALLEADTHHEIRNMAEMMRWYMEATNTAGSSKGE